MVETKKKEKKTARIERNGWGDREAEQGYML